MGWGSTPSKRPAISRLWPARPRTRGGHRVVADVSISLLVLPLFKPLWHSPCSFVPFNCFIADCCCFITCHAPAPQTSSWTLSTGSDALSLFTTNRQHHTHIHNAFLDNRCPCPAGAHPRRAADPSARQGQGLLQPGDRVGGLSHPLRAVGALCARRGGSSQGRRCCPARTHPRELEGGPDCRPHRQRPCDTRVAHLRYRR